MAGSEPTTGDATGQSGVAEARAGRTVSCITWHGYDTPMRTGNYLKRNKITLKSIYVSDDDTTISKVKEGGIDLGAGPEVEFIRPMALDDVCEPISIDRIANYKNIVPFFADNPLLKNEEQQYAVPFTWGTIPMLYRPDLVSEPPTSWLDVLRPEYKGRVVMVGGPWGNVRLWGRIVTGASAGWMTRSQLKETIDFLIKLKKEHALVQAGFDEVADIMARGDAVISTFGWEPIVQWAAAKGATLAISYPKEGTVAYVDTYFIAKNAPNYDAALGLIDDALSTEAQLALAADLRQGIVNREAIDRLPPDLREAYPYDDLANFGGRARSCPFPPLEDDGVHATYRAMQVEWERFKAA